MLRNYWERRPGSKAQEVYASGVFDPNLPFRLLDFGQEYFTWAEIDLEYLTCVSGQ